MSEEPKTGLDGFEQMVRMQQEWAKGVTDFRKAFTPRKAEETEGADGLAWAQNFYRNWTQQLQEMATRMLPGTSGIGPDTFVKMYQSADTYTKFFSFWIELYRKFMESIPQQWQGEWKPERFEEFWKAWVEQYRQLVDNVFAAAVPEPLRWITHVYTGEVPLLAADLLFKLWSPWTEFGAETLARPPVPTDAGTGMSSIIEFYDRWRKAYEASLGKLLRAPGLGYFRESYEKLMGGIDSLVEFNIVLADFNGALYQAGVAAMQKLLEKLGESMAAGEYPSTFREFYEQWWKTNEDIYEDLFRTEEFGKLLGQIVHRGMQFRKAYHEFLEEVVKQLDLPVPTRSEMDNLYKTVYELRKTVRKQARELESLKNITSTSAAASA